MKKVRRKVTKNDEVGADRFINKLCDTVVELSIDNDTMKIDKRIWKAFLRKLYEARDRHECQVRT